jgi:hypothetical protein
MSNIEYSVRRNTLKKNPNEGDLGICDSPMNVIFNTSGGLFDGFSVSYLALIFIKKEKAIAMANQQFALLTQPMINREMPLVR